ncbi:MAG TPA: MarC family protein [Saprospiraceae bacterium]|jgi:multiple antibiotic resistance protein|nr:MarC family protein [Saprospiraceae bacterium]MBK6664877.1 MarC family protein [Saprospiraceae bacterium]MBK8828831.1 MarC family protein [Saprospiraceae bacterium]MBK9581547.1 MarC family protein [Saprospiraceae bacterium]MBP6539477.1 MarC family protein [Saprospiraceae bacterium]
MSVSNILSIALILFSVIDIVGNIPVIIDLKKKGVEVDSMKAALVSLGLMVAFLYGGEGILKLFGLDVQSFAVAGAIIIFFLGLEMILGVRFFKESAGTAVGTVVPIAFPLIAGAGTMTTLISLKSKYENVDILAAIFLNIIVVFAVLHFSDYIKEKLGDAGAAILRKVFGIILLAIAIKLFKENFHLVITPQNKLGFARPV